MPSEEIDEGGENEDERSVEGPLDMIYVAVHSKSAISAVSRRTFGIFSRTFVFSWCELRGRVLLFVRRDPKTHDAVGLRQVLRLNNPGVTARYDRGRRQIKLRVPSTTSKAAAHVRLRVASGCHPGFSKPRGYLDMWWTFIAQSTNDNDGKWLDIAQLGPVRLGTFTGDSDDRDEDEEDEDNDEDEDEYDESEDDAYDESDDVFDDEDDGGEEKKMEMEFPVVSYVKGGR